MRRLYRIAAEVLLPEPPEGGQDVIIQPHAENRPLRGIPPLDRTDFEPATGPAFVPERT
jgi:hypothetical protein